MCHRYWSGRMVVVLYRSCFKLRNKWSFWRDRDRDKFLDDPQEEPPLNITKNSPIFMRAGRFKKRSRIFPTGGWWKRNDFWKKTLLSHWRFFYIFLVITNNSLLWPNVFSIFIFWTILSPILFWIKILNLYLPHQPFESEKQPKITLLRVTSKPKPRASTLK